ncbi:MAG TPA: peptidase T [Flavobacteriales bacterium]|jgi:tripeptide aminopeptidase|nr:peptidase T [Flavobacteriales bacterium]
MDKYGAVNRFINYVKIDTQSDPHSNTFPSTDKQLDLARQLFTELVEMGAAEVELDEYGYVFATIPANTNKKNVPVICFCSHMDTSPDASGMGVEPIIHSNYQGQDLVLPKDKSIVLKAQDHTDLYDQIGNDIITASGDTLLGADNKAGVAEIMAFAEYLKGNQQVKHGDIRILFTPDEEIGKGVHKLNLKKLNANYAYSIDGKTRGSIEDETFSADAVKVTIYGVSAHPGFGKNRLENATKIAGEFLASLPKDTWSPETTEGRDGFVHPLEVRATAEKAEITFIIRSFVDSDLIEYENRLETLLKSSMASFPNSHYTFDVTEQYRNMKNVLDQHPQVVEYAIKAIKQAGMEPKRGSIRGGTDGSQLSFMGLPCPNIFAGEHAFHSKYEWVSVQDMEKVVETLINLVQIWESES